MSQLAKLLTILFVTSVLITMSGCCEGASGTQLLVALNLYDATTNTWNEGGITLGTLFGDLFDSNLGAIALAALGATIIVGTIFGSSPQGYLLVPAIISIAVFVNDLTAIVGYISTPWLKSIVGITMGSLTLFYTFSLVRFWFGND